MKMFFLGMMVGWTPSVLLLAWFAWREYPPRMPLSLSKREPFAE